MNSKPITIQEIVQTFSKLTDLPDHILLLEKSLEKGLYEELLRWGGQENLPFGTFSLVLYRDIDSGKPVFVPFGHLFNESNRPETFPLRINRDVIETARRKIQADSLFAELTDRVKAKKHKI
ncbi:TPA: hypothetical protein QDB51_002643 [Burkholderia vietnamiensis]|nr:hypothetical protein [Burkholderia vietnamiensis]